jgi:S1-C subfamily serine protease
MLYMLLMPGAPQLTEAEVDAAVAEAIASITPAPAYSAQVYAVIQPSLVLVQSHVGSGDEQTRGSKRRHHQPGSDIVTNLHVVADAAEISLSSRMAVKHRSGPAALPEGHSCPAPDQLRR